MNKHLPYDRAERVSDAIFHLVSEVVLRDIADPRLKDVRITRVGMTRDLRIARIYYHLNDATEKQKDRMKKGFQSAAGFLRRRIGEELSLKFTPDVECFYDEGIDVSERVDDLLRAIREGGANG